MPLRGLFLALTVLPMLALSLTSRTAAATEAQTVNRALELLSPAPDTRRAALAYFSERGKKDAIPALIQAFRFAPHDRKAFVTTMRKLAGEDVGERWFDWMLWQEGQDQLKPFEGFDEFKARVMALIDPNFELFLFPGVVHEIRLEEITWGGVRKDGIPALTNPKLVTPAEAKYLTDDELVFGVSINGDARAYPLRILDWHEMFNDVIGGVSVSLAYCTLCGSGILFETTVKGREKPFVFGSSGFLYRSNKLMYDTETNSLWNQFTGRPVVGKLTGSGIELKTRPVVITRWSDWLARHPKTRVLSLDTGHDRDYRPGRPYGSYFASPDLMFPTRVDQSKLKAKDYVFALRSSGTEKAWPLSLFKKQRVINDTAGALAITLVGDAATRTVRAYRTGGEAFGPADTTDALMLDGVRWQVTEDALVGPKGEKLHRLPGHIAYWFAWSGYLGKAGELAKATN